MADTDYNKDYDASQANVDMGASLADQNDSFASENEARMRSLDAQASATSDWDDNQTEVQEENSLNARRLRNDPTVAGRKLVQNADDQYMNANRQYTKANEQFDTADSNFANALTDSYPETTKAETKAPKRKRRRKQRKQTNKSVEHVVANQHTTTANKSKTNQPDQNVKSGKGSDQMSENNNKETNNTTETTNPNMYVKQLDQNVGASLDKITHVINLRESYQQTPEEPKVLKQIQDSYNQQFDQQQEVNAKNAPELLEKMRQSAVKDAKSSVQAKADYLDKHPELVQSENDAKSADSPTSSAATSDQIGNNHSSKPTNQASSETNSSAFSAANSTSTNSASAVSQAATPTGAASAATPHVTQPMGKDDAGLANPKLATGTMDSATPTNAKVEKAAAADKSTVLDDQTSDHTAKTAEDVDAKLNRLELENKKLRENFKKQERIKKLEMENAQMQGGVSPDKLDAQQQQKDRKKDSYASKFKQANEEMRGVSNGKLAVVAATRFGKGALAVSGKVVSASWKALKATGRFVSRQVDKMSGKMTNSLENSLPESTVKQARENEKRQQGMDR